MAEQDGLSDVPGQVDPLFVMDMKKIKVMRVFITICDALVWIRDRNIRKYPRLQVDRLSQSRENTRKSI